MTVSEMLSLTRGQLRDAGRLRYKTGTATGGAADGTTVTHGLGGVTDGWNEMEIKMTGGNNNGQRRGVGDSTSTVFTLFEPFLFQVSTDAFEIGERGFISDHELIELFTVAQDVLINMIVTDAFPAHTDTIEVAGVAGVSAALPDTLAGPPDALAFKDTSGNVYDVTVLPPGEQDRFRNDSFMGSTLEDMVAIFKNGKISYRPINNGTLLLEVLPKFASVDFTTGNLFPAYLHHLQITYAVSQAWKKKERLDMAQQYLNEFTTEVNAINRKYGVVIKRTGDKE